MSDYDYLSCAETAKLIRAQLKKHFPGSKFYVRSKTYSGGASIDIDYVDGAPLDQVERIAKSFEGADFDGMIDLKSYNESYLMPDGSALPADISGTTTSRGYIDERHYTAPANAKKVHFGSDYVFVNRHYSPEKAQPIIRAICEKHGRPEPRYYLRDWWLGNETQGKVLDWDCRDVVFNDAEWMSSEIHAALRAADLQDQPAPQPEVLAPDAQESITVSYDRDWTWIHFDQKPSEATRELMKTQLHARFSGRRSAWYVMEHVDEQTIRVQLAAV